MQLNRINQGKCLLWLAGAVFMVVRSSLVLAESVSQGTEPNAEPQQTEQVADQQAPATFDLLELRVKGNTLIDKKQLERTIYPFLGLKKSVDNVEAARATLEELYRTQGYQTVSVDIPEQDVKNGVVYLQVVEGKVSRLRVQDSRYFALGKIKAGVPELAEGNVPNFPKMQQQLAELGGQSPDRQIQPVLRAGETPGTLEVDLKVDDELPLHGKVELNGRNTSSTSRLRLVSSLRYDNLWQEMHSASLMYQVSPEDNKEVDVWAGTYAMPLINSDTRLALYAVSSSSNAQIASAGALSVVGIGNIYGARLVHPLNGMDDYFHTITLGVDYKDFKENVKLLGDDSAKSPISYLPFMAEYNGTLSGKELTTSFEAGVHFSVRGLGNEQRQFDCLETPTDSCLDEKGFEIGKREGAKANYVYLTGDLKNTYNLPLDMALNSHFSGQVSDTPLISNEQFSMGGDDNVRGYFETQSLADNGVFGSVELHSPHLGAAEWDYLDNLKVLAFLDAAKGWVKQPSPGTSSGDFLSSAGLGMRFQMWKHLSGALDIGIPFISLEPVKAGDPRLHFNIATDF